MKNAAVSGLIAAVLIGSFPGAAPADTVRLKSGEILTGTVESAGKKEVTINIPGTGKITLSRDVIASVEKEKKAAPPPPGPDTVYSPRHGLRLDKPSGWMKEYEHVPGKSLKEFARNAARFIWIFRENGEPGSPEMSVTWNVPSKEYDAQDYAAFLNGQNLKMRQANPGVDVVENTRIVTLNGRPFIRTVLLYQDQANIYYHFLRGRTGYTLGCLGPRKSLEKYKALCEKTAASVAFDAGERPGGYDLATAEEAAMLADQYYSSGQYDAAIEAANQALAKNPDPQLKASLFVNLSSDYLEKGIAPYQSAKDTAFYEKSIAYARECLKIKPEAWQAIGNIATVYQNTGDLAKADEYYSIAEKFADQGSPYYKQMMAQHVEVRRRMQFAQEAGSSGIGVWPDKAWDPAPGKTAGHPAYSKRKMKFAVRRVENPGKNALQWAEDEVDYLRNTTPPVTITQRPQQVRLGNRVWYEMRFETKALVMKVEMLSVQWYSQDGPHVLEAFLIGPKEEVLADLKNITKALAEMRLESGG